MTSGDLFTTSPTASDPAVNAPVLLTNVPNLLHFLSMGVVGPHECFRPDDNYYTDFLSSAPCRLVVLRPPFHPEAVEYVRSESRRVARPVVVEFEPGTFDGVAAPALDGGGVPSVLAGEDPSAYALGLSAVLPVASVARVGFFTQEDLDDFLTRGFGNVQPLPKDAVYVLNDGAYVDEREPEAGGRPDVPTLLSWLTELAPPPGSPGSDAFEVADRASGALSLLHRVDVSAASPMIDDFSGTLTTFDGWFDASADRVADEVVFDSAARVIVDTSPYEWKPSHVLDRVWEGVRSSELPADQLDQLEKGVDRIAAILRNEEDFTPSKSERYPALQGLMLVLLRSRPDQVVEWPQEETRAGELAHATAAIYAGLLHGRVRLPLGLREPEVDSTLAAQIVESLSTREDLQVNKSSVQRESAPEVGASPENWISALLSGDLESEGRLRSAAIELCGYVEALAPCVTSRVIFPEITESSPALQFTSKGSRFNNRKLTTWAIPGVVEVRHELDITAFQEALERAEVPEKVIERVGRAVR